MNWSVASGIVDILQTIGEPLAPYILSVLQGDDDIWKYCVLTELAVHFDQEARAFMMNECIRIVNEPTDGERAEDCSSRGKGNCDLIVDG